MSNSVHRTGLWRFLERLGAQKSLMPLSMFALPRVPAAHGMEPRIVFLASLLEMDVEVVRVAFQAHKQVSGTLGYGRHLVICGSVRIVAVDVWWPVLGNIAARSWNLVTWSSRVVGSKQCSDGSRLHTTQKLPNACR